MFELLIFMTNEIIKYGSGNNDEQGRRKLALVKHGHHYEFTYSIGDECKVMKILVELARDPKSELDMFDASVLSHQLGQNMAAHFEKLRREKRLDDKVQ